MGDKAPSLKRVHTEDRSVSPPPVKRRQQSTTTSQAVASFFTPASQRSKPSGKKSWAVINDSLLVGHSPTPANAAKTEPEAAAPCKIAIFDFDSTLITTKSGNRFGRDADDWKWWHANVPTTLRQLHQDGYLIAILSNQGGISLKSKNGSKAPKADMKRLADFKTKATAIFTALDLPVSLYAATAQDEFRKPRTGMWRQLLEEQGLGADGAVDLEKSFFVGDAGGRSGRTSGGVTTRGDFSCSDRDFAANVGIRFHTPEEYFLGEAPVPFVRDFDPALYLNSVAGAVTPDSVPPVFAKNNAVDIVLLCGSPGAGKSTYYWRVLEPLGYKRVNQDLLKKRDKCLKSAADYLAEGASVAVDNTNADPETRAHWVKLAKQHGVPIRCIFFTAPAKLCEHNDAVRALSGSGGLNPESRTRLPPVAFSSYAKRFRAPTPDEGFQDVTTVVFKFEGDERELAVWAKFWL